MKKTVMTICTSIILGFFVISLLGDAISLFMKRDFFEAVRLFEPTLWNDRTMCGAIITLTLLFAMSLVDRLLPDDDDND